MQTQKSLKNQAGSHIQLAQERQQQIPISTDSEFIFGFNVSTNQISSLFQSVAFDKGFQLIQSEQYHATAIKQQKKNFIQIIDCFNWWSEGNVTGIKMAISMRQKDSKRICRIRGLIGSKKQVMSFIECFKIRSRELANSKQIVHESEQQQIQINSHQTNPFYLESCAAYMFHKILSNDKYGIGKLLHTSIDQFNEQFADPEESVNKLPLPMKKAIGIIEDIVQNLYKDFNYGRQQMQQIMPYCRISVEKYVFDKINKTLVAIYELKNKKVIQQFAAKQQKILKQLPPSWIYKQIGISKKMWFIQQNQEQLLEKQGAFLQMSTSKKYGKAIKQFERIKATISPREKVKHCQIMYTYLKTIIYEESHGKYELFNMEDIIPILILVLLLSDVKNVKIELDMMVDFIGFDPCDLQSQRRLLVNTSESFNYLVRDFKAEKEE